MSRCRARQPSGRSGKQRDREAGATAYVPHEKFAGETGDNGPRTNLDSPFGILARGAMLGSRLDVGSSHGSADACSPQLE